MTEQQKFIENIRTPQSLWYFGCPYTHEDPQVMENRVADLKKCEEHVLIHYHGIVPYFPVLDTLRIIEQTGITSIEIGWYAHVMAFLRRSDHFRVITFDGWEDSFGLAIEIMCARENNIPVSFASFDEMLSDEIPF